METIGLALACFAAAVLGFWMMHRIDLFLNGPDVHPYWDEREEERAALRARARVVSKIPRRR